MMMKKKRIGIGFRHRCGRLVRDWRGSWWFCGWRRRRRLGLELGKGLRLRLGLGLGLRRGPGLELELGKGLRLRLGRGLGLGRKRVRIRNLRNGRGFLHALLLLALFVFLLQLCAGLGVLHHDGGVLPQVLATGWLRDHDVPRAVHPLRRLGAELPAGFPPAFHLRVMLPLHVPRRHGHLQDLQQEEMEFFFFFFKIFTSRSLCFKTLASRTRNPSCMYRLSIALRSSMVSYWP